MLMWIFGDVKENIVHRHGAETASGRLVLENADVEWMLSIDAGTLPAEAITAGKRTFRSLMIDGDSFEFSDGFTELHTISYQHILAGQGFPLSETRKVIQLVHDIRNAGVKK
jgi:UDP-N-acetyl-2-amino-2-deoxyglucuronate dehydrogenase